MLSISRLALLVSSLTLTSAHFLMLYPPSIGFDDDLEGQGPCGSFAIPSASETNGTDIPISGFPIYLQSTHPEATWLMRASTERSDSGWQNIEPVIMQTGLGKFCLPQLALPPVFAGKSGLIQIMQDAVDGILYQCAAVTFSAGANTSVSCMNATGLTATLTSQQAFNSSALSSASSLAATISSTTQSPSIAATSTGGTMTTSMGAAATTTGVGAAPASTSGAAVHVEAAPAFGLAAMVIAAAAYIV